MDLWQKSVIIFVGSIFSIIFLVSWIDSYLKEKEQKLKNLKIEALKKARSEKQKEKNKGKVARAKNTPFPHFNVHRDRMTSHSEAYYRRSMAGSGYKPSDSYRSSGEIGVTEVAIASAIISQML